MKNFDLSVEDGSMVLSDGKEFVISIGENPSISFSNEYGSYDMSFANVKGVSKGTKAAMITSDRAFFYKEPNVLTKRKAYMVKGQTVNYNIVSGDYFYAVFINEKGSKTEGWMLNSDVDYIE